jgi:hypothetical protein
MNYSYPNQNYIEIQHSFIMQWTTRNIPCLTQASKITTVTTERKKTKKE